MHILFTPNPTGSGHNMRTLAIIEKLFLHKKNIRVTVVLSSLENIFFGLYKNLGCNVITLPSNIKDHSKISHLTKEFNWETYIEKYISASFLNCSLILKYTSIYLEEKPDLVVSDYNLSASAAAHIGDFNHALVTERYDFTLFQISNDELKEAGFIVNCNEIDNARKSLHTLFEGIIRSAKIILTDKPYLPDFDKDTAIGHALDKGKVKFVGPMIRDIPYKNKTNKTELSKLLNIKISYNDIIIVASVGGTTMFVENKNKLIKTYIDLYGNLHKKIKNLKMILICREKIDAPNGVYVYDYIPNWLPLLNRANILLSAPGWITATEIALLKIPVIFILSDLSEYHEVEASKRLKSLGFNSYINPNIDFLSKEVFKIINNNNFIDIKPYTLLAPYSDGAEKAADYLIKAVNDNTPFEELENKITRMLLSSNSSTTILLESLFNSIINVKVTSQNTEKFVSREFIYKFANYFDTKKQVLIKRESLLFTGNDQLVCAATIYYQKNSDFYIPDKDTTQPLGKKLIANQVKQHRKIISSGNTTWIEKNKSCAYKEYIINLDTNHNIYVMEKFNPEFISPLYTQNLSNTEA